MTLRRTVGVATAALLSLGALAVGQTTAQAHSTKPTTAHQTISAHKPLVKGPGAVVPANAACGTGAPDKDGSAWNATGGGANMRSGSSTSCAILSTADSGNRLDYHCYTYGNDGYTWTYLRNDSKGTYGWVRDDLLSDHGSFVLC
jgi:hypothetical protein